jgi:hypothetical protein
MSRKVIMASFIQQLPALIGVVIGASASYLAGAATERARWRREQATRWDEKRAQAYADYGYAIKNVYVQCRRIADNHRGLGGGYRGPGGNYRGQGARSKSFNYAEAISELGQLTDERTAKWESVLLLGSPETITAARTWHRRAWHVELFARGERTDAAEWKALLKQFVVDRERFYAAARSDLGIESGDVPPSGPWEESPLVSSGGGPSEVPPDVA